MRYVTPLRYPGGKTQLANFMKLVFRDNDLIGGHYAEPYAGGASIAFHLLLHGYATHIYINDLSKSVHAFWWAVLYDTENLCRLIADTRVSIKSWHLQRMIQESPGQHSTLELGFSTFFLNRTNRSGIITGGVIGGKKQDGVWNLDARYNKETLLSRITKIAFSKDKISLYNQDATDFIIRVVPSLPERSLIYLDPPYYSKGRRLYDNYYERDDHVSIADHVTKLRRKWIVSYDDTPEVRELYANFRQLSYKLSYSANARYQGSEIMFFCDDLIVPNVERPTKIGIPHNNGVTAATPLLI